MNVYISICIYLYLYLSISIYTAQRLSSAEAACGDVALRSQRPNTTSDMTPPKKRYDDLLLNWL